VVDVGNDREISDVIHANRYVLVERRFVKRTTAQPLQQKLSIARRMNAQCDARG
jgi:hypothetical protein